MIPNSKAGQKRGILPPLSTPSTPLRTSKSQGQGRITIHDASSLLFSDETANDSDNNNNSGNSPTLFSPLKDLEGLNKVEALSSSTTTTSTGVVYNLPVRVVRYDGPRFRKGGGATVVQPKVTASQTTTPQKSSSHTFQSELELEEDEDGALREPPLLSSSPSFNHVLIEDVNKIIPNHSQQHHAVTSVLTSRLSIVQQARRFWLCGDYIGALSSTLFSSYSLPPSQNSIATPDLAIQGDTEMTFLVLSKILKQNSECLNLECTETLMSAVDKLLKYGKKREGTLALRVGCILVELFRDLAEVITRLENSLGVESVTPVMRGKSIALRKYLVSEDGLSMKILDHAIKIKEDTNDIMDVEIVGDDLDNEEAEGEEYYKKWRRRLENLIDQLRESEENKTSKT